MKNTNELVGKKVAESRITVVRRFFPGQTNSRGNIHGAFLPAMMDEVGPMVALRHARSPVVTAAVEQMSFSALFMRTEQEEQAKRLLQGAGYRIEG